MLTRIRTIYHEFPSKFWVLVAAMFIDKVGATLIFPFFALYITQKFGVGMTQAGLLIGLFSLAGLVGSMAGGALTDRFGRKIMILFGLIVSAISAVAMGLVNELNVFYVLAIIVGLLSDIAGPAWGAMIGDMLPEEQRTEGFGVLRVVGNMAWIVGPTIGGLMATRSYLLLFIMDAITSSLTALIIYRMIPETKPEAAPGEPQESVMQTLAGYRKVLADHLYVVYIVVSIMLTAVYIQMYNSLSVYLRDEHGVTPQGYGFLLTSSAITVILLQFWVSRRVKNYPPMLMMTLGSLFYMVGFSMFGIVAFYVLFVLAIVIITFGEMIIMPVSQAMAVNFAPIDMRGRYMAVFGLTYAIPATLAPIAAGVIIDNFNPNWVWYLGGILCGLSAAGFYWLNGSTRVRFASVLPQESSAD